jgi:hypothetical protein
MLANQQGVSYWAIVIVLAFVVVAMIVALWPQDETLQENISPATLWSSIRNRAQDINEKAKIEKWIVDNKLNEYGDSADTLYTGGTPLFDEQTGETMDRFEYIRINHPDEPWNK